MPTAHAPQAGSHAGGGRSFRRWRRARPFWGGLLLILSGVELFLSGNLNLGAMQVHLGPTGFLSYVIPAMLVLCGAGTWMTPNLRLFYGILGSLVAVYSLIGVNLGGFLIGLLLGIIGGALSISWTVVAAPVVAAPVAAEPETPALPPLVDPPADSRPRYDHGQPYEGLPAYGETAEIPRQVENPERWWGASETGGHHSAEEPPPYGSSSGGNHNRLLAITLVPVTLAAVLVAVAQQPPAAYASPAVPCPSASAPPSKAPKPSKTPTPAPSKTASTPTRNGAGSGNSQQSASASPSATAKGSGNPLVDGWNGLIHGLGNLFGGGAAATPAATPSASPSPSVGGLLPGLPGLPGLPRATPSRPQPSASGSGVPCLGAHVFKTATPPPGLVRPAATHAILSGSSVTMYNSTYDGVVKLRTDKGIVEALQFTMDKSVTTPFQLKVPEPNGKSTLITSSALTTSSAPDTTGHVKFYTSKFTGKLFGLIPVTFTPSMPPPLMLPVLSFTDPVIELVLVRCDTLTAPDIHISEV